MSDDTAKVEANYNAGWLAMKEAVLAILDEPVTYGYVPDIGCYACFDRVKAAIEALCPESQR